MDKSITPDSPVKDNCPSCGKPLKGRFCHRCGEKKFKSGDLSLFRLFRESLSKLTHIDTNFFRTYKMLLLRPGALTDAYCKGNRKPYLKPLQTFLLANLFYFILLQYYQNDIFYFSADNYIRFKPLGIDYRALLAAAAIEQNTPLDELKEVFNTNLREHAKSWVILNVPMMALMLSVLFYRKERYFAEHFIMAMHYYAFLLLYICMLSAVAVGIYFAGGDSDPWQLEVLALFIFVYLYLALWKYYKGTWWMVLLKLIPLYFGLIVSLNLYRLFLFTLTLRLL